MQKSQPQLKTSLFSNAAPVTRAEAAKLLFRFRKSSSKPICQETPTNRIYRAAAGHAADWFTLIVNRTPGVFLQEKV